MIKLFISILFVLIAMLVLCKAPTNLTWKVAVALTNFPYVPMLLAAILFYFGVKATSYHWPIMISSLVAFIIFSLPIIAGYRVGNDMAKNISNIFAKKNTSNLPTAFSFFNMFRGNVREPFKIVTYKIVDTTNLTSDFYAAKNNKPSPLIITIHGGSWQSGDSKQLPELNSYLAAKGYNVAAINYRLAPTYKAPAPVEDTKAVIDFFTKHAAEYNIDINNIILLGRSAGAQIALCAAYTLQYKNIKGVVSYYGPADMVWGAQVRVSKKVLNTNKIYDDYFGGQYEQVPEKFIESSAVHQAKTNATPTLIIHGTIDPLVSYTHALHLQKKLNELQVPNYFLSIPFATHGCDYNLNGPAGQLCTYAVMEFLQSVAN